MTIGGITRWRIPGMSMTMPPKTVKVTLQNAMPMAAGALKAAALVLVDCNADCRALAAADAAAGVARALCTTEARLRLAVAAVAAVAATVAALAAVAVSNAEWFDFNISETVCKLPAPRLRALTWALTWEDTVAAWLDCTT
jgi:hypothetical protein